MGKHEKLLIRIQAKPKDFTWVELTTLLSGLGYREAKTGKTGGSRRRFVHETALPIVLHKPHPGTILKPYAVKDVLNALKERGMV